MGTHGCQKNCRQGIYGEPDHRFLGEAILVSRVPAVAGTVPESSQKKGCNGTESDQYGGYPIGSVRKGAIIAAGQGKKDQGGEEITRGFWKSDVEKIKEKDQHDIESPKTDAKDPDIIRRRLQKIVCDAEERQLQQVSQAQYSRYFPFVL